MPDSKAQFPSHACISDDRPFMISSSLQFPSSHTKEHTQVGPSVKDYHQAHQNHHHRNSPLGLPYHQPHSHQLDIFDPAFQSSVTHGSGLVPMPVAYEDFQYHLANIELAGQVAPNAIGSTGPQHSNPGLIYQTYPTGPGSYGPNCHLPMSTGWDLAPMNQTQLPSSDMPQDLLLNNFLNEPIQYEQSHPSSALPPLLPSAPTESISRASNHLTSDHHFHNPSRNLSDNSQMNYPPPNPPTPPPLFDATEQDLLSSFLTIIGDPHGECDFDPQGMPEGMPVLGELKRRLEEENMHEGSPQFIAKREADDVRRQVETRLKISDPDSVYPHGRRPSLQSFHTTSGSLSSSSDSHLYQDQSFLSRKKAKTTNLINSFDLHPPHLIQSPLHQRVDLEGDTKMGTSWDYNPSCDPGDWPGAVIPHPCESSHSDHLPQMSQLLPKPFKSSFSQSAPLSPVSQPTNGSHKKNNSLMSFEIENSASTQKVFAEQGSSVHPRRVSKRGSKPPKSTHIVSEQRRRNAIQGGFGSLVEILRAGEAISGISIAVVDSSSANTHPNTDTNGTSNPNPKPKTRGRGRRGEIETGASKSVVLERAAEFVQWMIDGNSALKNEVQRVERILKNRGVEV